MKNLVFIFLWAVLFATMTSCKKENSSTGGGSVPIVYSDKIVLSIRHSELVETGQSEVQPVHDHPAELQIPESEHILL